MKEILVSAGTLPEAYHQALLELWKNGEYTPCPDYNTNQKECSMTMVVEEADPERKELLRKTVRIGVEVRYPHLCWRLRIFMLVPSIFCCSVFISGSGAGILNRKSDVRFRKLRTLSEQRRTRREKGQT